MKRKITLYLLLFLGVVGSSTFFCIHKKQREKSKQTALYEPKTWSHFHQFHHLQMVLKGFDIQSMIDIPCRNVEIVKEHDLGLKQYLGITESKEEAQVLQARFGSQVRSFMNLQLTMDILPRADLILAWDLLCTLSPSQVRAALLSFKKSGAKFLLMSHFPELQKNHKNRTGAFQPVNWKLPPYHFPEPIIQIIHHREQEIEALSLWSLESLP